MDPFPAAAPTFPPNTPEGSSADAQLDPLLVAALLMFQNLRRLPKLLPDDDLELTRLRAGILALVLTAKETTPPGAPLCPDRVLAALDRFEHQRGLRPLGWLPRSE